MAKHTNATKDPTGILTAQNDTRSKIAKDRRARMKKRLLFAALDVFWVSEVTKPPVIDDVIRKAGVSRGTFYKYFDSLETVLIELGQMLANDMIATYERIFEQLQAPIARVAAGPLLSLTHAAMQPKRVAFTSRVDYVDYLSRGNRLWQVITVNLENARQVNALNFTSLDAATDLVIGTTLEGSRRVMHKSHVDQSYIHELVGRILLGCGASALDGKTAIDNAWQVLTAYADNLSWWRPLPSGNNAPKGEEHT